MNPTDPNNLGKGRRRPGVPENHEESERIHNMVVKIISWKSGLVDGAVINKTNKITPKEWDAYRQHILTISKITSPEKVKAKLAETFKAIKKNGGFE